MRVFGGKKAPEVAPVEKPLPRFVCITCGSTGPFYVAREVVNWTRISQPYRTPDSSLTYRLQNLFLPGDPGPPLAFSCGECGTKRDALEELVLEPGLTQVTP